MQLVIIVRTSESNAQFTDADAALRYEQALREKGRAVEVDTVSEEEAQAELKGQ